MLVPFHFGFFCLFVSLWCKDAAAFVCGSSGQKASRGAMIDGANCENVHPRAFHILKAGATSSASSETEDAKSALLETEDNYYFSVLQKAIHKNATEASSELLSRISDMRQGSDFTQGQQEAFLNGLLALGPDAQLPLWTILRPLARFSRRARMRSLRRTLNIITPDPVDDDSMESRLQRRRRALVSLLRNLSGSLNEFETEENEAEADADAGSHKSRSRPAIVALEQKAIQASKDSASDLTSRRPEGLETPAYEVLISGKDSSTKVAKNIEIRSYQPYSVCTVAMNKPQQSDESPDKTDQKQLPSSFGALAGYLFGKNDQSTAMKMTTPVFTTNPGEVSSAETAEKEEQSMAFVLPSDYWGTENLSKAPMPLESSGVTLQERSSEVRAVLMFGGYASKKEAEKRKKELYSALSKRDSEWEPIEDTLSLAQYNDPFTVPWRRLNEVSVQVRDS